jgi:hypothetical protein
MIKVSDLEESLTQVFLIDRINHKRMNIACQRFLCGFQTGGIASCDGDFMAQAEKLTGSGKADPG